MEINHVVWLGTNNCIGIVTGKTTNGEVKSYIGMGYGSNEQTDIIAIAESGAPVLPGILQEILDLHNKPKEKQNDIGG